MPTNSIIDQRRMTQARIDALFAGKLSTEAFLRTRKWSDDTNHGSYQGDVTGSASPQHIEAARSFR